ncbi:MAG: hypothetical protein JNK44_10600 [Cyclobacteriaceae bacterium]|nr:hypothetical protein [Cyclobacteriaceae bacterium]
MKKFINTILLLYTGVKILLAQLPASSASVNLTTNESSTVVVSPVIWKDRGPTSLISITYQASHQNRWKYFTEVSGIERFNTSGVAFALRDNHISKYKSIERTFKILHSAFNSVSVSLSNFMIWDKNTSEKVTQEFDVTSTLKGTNGSYLIVLIQKRNDILNRSFLYGDLLIKENVYNLNSFSIRYSAQTKSRLSSYLEATMGTYYANANRYSFRIGERFNLTPRFCGFADVELNKVTGESDVNSYLIRIKLDWKLSRNMNSGLFCLHNSANDFKGLIAFTQFRSQRHNLRLEYREIRNTNFRIVESTHPIFSSKALIHYTYSLPAKGGS